MPGRTSSRASPNSRYMSSRQTSPSSRQWPWMVEKFSARSWLNRIRCDLNSASASISLTTPDMCPLLCAVPAGPPAEALELGRELVQAHLDDIRVFRDAAGGDVLHPAVIRDLDLLFLHERADGRGQRRQEAVHFGVPVGELGGYLAEQGPQRVDGAADSGGRHRVADAPQLLAVDLPARLPQCPAQLSGGAVLPGAGQ